MGRDPKQEGGGINLYGFCRNNSINLWDYLGMEPIVLDPFVVREEPVAPWVANRYQWSIWESDGDYGTQIMLSQMTQYYYEQLNRYQNLASEANKLSDKIKWDAYGTGREITPEMMAQAKDQLDYLDRNETKSGEYIRKAIDDGWSVTISVSNKDEGQMGGYGGLAHKADHDLKMIRIQYDPRYGGAGYFVDGEYVRPSDGTSVLAHELGHMYENIYNNNRSNEHEATRLENEIRVMQGYRPLEGVPDYDKYIRPKI